MKKLIQLTMAMLALALWNCSKSEIFMDCPYHTTGNNPTNDTTGNSNMTSALVSFSAAIENLIQTRSMSPIQKGVMADIYAYNSIKDSLTASGHYQSNTLGTLSGLNGYKMFLSNGAYNFYAVSTNDNLQPPSFSNGTSQPLTNGVDYLWWECQNQDIYASSVNLNIVFTHEACQVVFKLSEGEGIVIDSLVSIYTTAPTEGATMDLKTGIITPATSQQVGFVNEMGINGWVAQSIILPTNNWKYMGVIIRAFVNSETSERFFGGQIPIPNSTLSAGNSYQFSLILNGNSVSTSSVNVASWTIVNDNIPIYTPEL